MFISVQLTLVVICILILWRYDVYDSSLQTLNQAFFQVVSMVTNPPGLLPTVLPSGRCFYRYCCSARRLLATVSMLTVVATGVDNFSAFAAVAVTLNNLGSGLGSWADNCTSMNAVAKWILILTMLSGRLEVFTLLVLFTPTYWCE